MSSPVGRGVVVLCAAALSVGAAACGAASPPVGSVARTSVAASIKTELARKNVQTDTVTCPADVAAVVGETVRCAFDVDGQPVDAVARVSSVAGGTARFAITTAARPIGRDLLSRKVGDQVRRQAGLQVDSATCAGDLAPTTGAVQSCTIGSAGTTRALIIRVTGVDGGLINYSIEQA